MSRCLFFQPMMRIALVATWMIVAVPLVRADGYARRTGEWIHDHARLYGLTVENPMPQDAEYVLVWMKAAAEVSPGLAEAWMWQYDLLGRMERPTQALAALDNYCKAAPYDLAAALERVALRVDEAQTAEQRIAVCEKLLAEQGIQDEVASDLHRRLAELKLSRLLTDEAVEHAHRALELFKYNTAARVVLAQAQERIDEPATRVRLALAEVAARPAWVGALNRLAVLLDELGMHARAIEWHKKSIEIFQVLQPEQQTPVELTMGLAWSYFDQGDDEAALALCEEVIAAQPTQPDALTLMIVAARRMGRPEVAEQHARTLDDRYRQLEGAAIEQHDAATCARIAWFHVDAAPEPQRAMRFAKLALGFDSGNKLARRALGWAHLLLGEIGQAVRVLQPLADQDQWAALGLARAQQAAGDEDAARKATRQAEELRPSGRAYAGAVELLRELGEEAAPKPDRAEVEKALDGFDGRVLDFPKDPGAAIGFEVAIVNATAAYADSIVGRFTLTNRAAYPITLGADQMIDPHVAVTIRDAAQRGETFADYLTVSLASRLVLEPGQSIAIDHRLSTVPAQFMLDPRPQRRGEFELSFVLAPRVDGEGNVVSALAGVEAVTQRVIRDRVDASAAGLTRLYDRLRSGSELERLDAIEVAVALILERGEIVAGRSMGYAATKVDVTWLQRVLLEALRDPTPVVRARALWAFTQLPLDETVTSIAAPLLADESWLVRMWAEDLFAKKQGAVFLPVLKKFADDDNTLVARLAELYRQYIEALLPAPRPRMPVPEAP